MIPLSKAYILTDKEAAALYNGLRDMARDIQARQRCDNWAKVLQAYGLLDVWNDLRDTINEGGQ